MAMKLAYHGGKCCGVKTIYGFGYPTYKVPALQEMEKNNKDQRGADVSSRDRVFFDAAPRETELERLDRYLQWLRDHRPKGLVEIYLIPYQNAVWADLLFERGFKADEPFQNSNSGNWITRYSLVMK